MKAFQVTNDEKINKMLDSNLLDIIRVTKAFIPYFREKKNVYLL